MEGPLSVFGDRSTGEAIRSQNGKDERGPGRAGPAAAQAEAQPRSGGRGHRLGTVKSPEERPGPSAGLTRGPARRRCALPCKGGTFGSAARFLGGKRAGWVWASAPRVRAALTWKARSGPTRLPRPTAPLFRF